MAEHRSVQAEVRAIARGGDAVAETPQGILLVAGALPGERIELVPTSSKRGVGRGRLKRILRRSELRRVPPCPVASRCGGCPLMLADEALQREIKLGFLTEACRGLPGADETRARWVESPESLGYRRRARLAWHHDAMGYRVFRSKRVTDVDDCIVLTEPLRLAWREVRRNLAPSLDGDGEIQLELTGAHRVVVSLQSSVDQRPALYEACQALAEQSVIAGVTLRTAEAGHAASWGEREIVVEAEIGSMSGPAGGFFQANDGVNAKLVPVVIDLSQPAGERVLELHSGVGNFTLDLAARAAKLVAVERDPRAVEACRTNLKQRGLRAHLIVGDANEPPADRFDVLVLDPPRQGAKTLFEQSPLLPGPKRIVYVSCDTATLGRDLRFATTRGYRIDTIIGFDMFPQTAHLESVVRLVRA
jgi:23S rRNA (uracil1939-C5)-methyltransferase